MSDRITEAMVKALREIAFMRPLGPCRSKLVERMERVAINALDAYAGALQHPQAALPVEDGWQTMDSAPRDGSPFIVKYLPYLGGYLCMRRVRWVADDESVALEDMGAWIIVGGIDDEFTERLPTSGDPDWSIASDKHNDTSTWKWLPLPLPASPTAQGDRS